MDRASYVYILANAPYGTLYVGVTKDSVRRVWEHKQAMVDGFTKNHKVHQLVWYEVHADLMAAVTREKRLKKFKSDWKFELIADFNPTWRDLYRDFTA